MSNEGQTGYAFKSKDFIDENEDAFPIIRMSNLDNGLVSIKDAARVSSEIVKGLDNYELHPGDFVFGMSGSLDNFGIIKEVDVPCYLNQRVGRLQVSNASEAYVRQLYISPIVMNQIYALAAGAAQKNISPKQIESVIVPFPPLPEQKKIAQILGSVDDAIQATQKTIEQTKKVKKGLLQDLLKKGIGHTRFKKTEIGEIPEEWEVVTYKDIADINSESLGNHTDSDTIIEYIDISSIQDTGVIGDTSIMCYEDAPSRAKRIVKKGDVLVSTVRPYLRSFAYIKSESSHLIASTGYAVLTPHTRIDGKYLYQTVLSESFVEALISRMKGSNYPAVNPSDVASVKLPLPTLSEQSKIIEILGSVDATIQTEQQKMLVLMEEKAGLMQNLLTGRVRVSI